MSAWSVSLLCRRCHSRWNFNYTIHFPHSDGVTMLEKTHSRFLWKTSVERQSKIKCGKTHISELSIERSRSGLLPPRTHLCHACHLLLVTITYCPITGWWDFVRECNEHKIHDPSCGHCLLRFTILCLATRAPEHQGWTHVKLYKCWSKWWSEKTQQTNDCSLLACHWFSFCVTKKELLILSAS